MGTGMAANLEPYTVAGKTGTALRPLARRRLHHDDFVSSFAGFVPGRGPRHNCDGRGGRDAPVRSRGVGAGVRHDCAGRTAGARHPCRTKRLRPCPDVPLATPYDEEGEAAGPALPGLVGTPDVQVGPSSSRSYWAKQDGARRSTTTTVR